MWLNILTPKVILSIWCISKHVIIYHIETHWDSILVIIDGDSINCSCWCWPRTHRSPGHLQLLALHGATQQRENPGEEKPRDAGALKKHHWCHWALRTGTARTGNRHEENHKNCYVKKVLFIYSCLNVFHLLIIQVWSIVCFIKLLQLKQIHCRLLCFVHCTGPTTNTDKILMESLVAPWMAQCLQQGVLLPNARFPNPWRRQECWSDVQKCTSFETNYLDSLCLFLAIVIPVAWNCYFESWGTSLSRKWRMFDDQMACIKAWCSRQHLSASTTSIVDKETWNNPSLTDHLKCASQANHWRRMTFHEAAVLIDSLDWTCPRLPRAMLATGVAKFTVRTVVEVLACASTIEIGYGGMV